MAVNLFVSLPHPRDALLNYGLSLMRDRIDRETHRVLCHGDMNDTPVQRHARNLLHGVDSRRDRVLEIMEWVNGLAAETPNLHIYNRFFLADYDKPASTARTDAFLELAWLYFGRLEPRLTFVDYGASLGGALEHCAALHCDKIREGGVDEAEAAGSAREYREGWSFSPEDFLGRATATFGAGRVKILGFDEGRTAADFADALHQAILAGKGAPALSAKDLAEMRTALQRRMKDLPDRDC